MGRVKLCLAFLRNIPQIMLSSLACAAGKQFQISSIPIEKDIYFTKVWGTHMLRVCLLILKNLPQYAYKLYAYKKKLYPLQV